MIKNTRPKYIFCWWCSRQLQGKSIHVNMRSTESANANAAPVSVHIVCAKTMQREGGWELESDAA